MMRWARQLWNDDHAAVAPTVALSLFGLIGAGGLAFDYARMAALDTELQQAVDQAALAAATQLDGSTNARVRATAAAQSLLRNTTLFADHAEGQVSDRTRVAIQAPLYYQTYDETTDVAGSAATKDEDAKVAIVSVVVRKASFALTPIIGLFDSGLIQASAVASMTSSICQVPPLMICAPTSDFPQPSDVGKGVLLQPGGGGAWVPGNYGYLDFGNGASGVRINLGRNNDAANCMNNSAGTPTEPGNQASVTKFLNTRFDLYAASVTACDPSTGDFCPSQNTRKDMGFREEVDVNGTAGTVPANPGCGAAGAKAGGKDNNVDSNGFVQNSPPLGYPRDTMHLGCGSSNSCTKIGDGAWNRTDFVAGVHSGTTVAAIATATGTTASTLKRWDVYQWELADRANRLTTTSHQVGSPVFKANGSSSNGKWTFQNSCPHPQPHNATGVAASATQKDRRLLTVAVVDCAGETGKFNAKVLRFADMFLVEPSTDRPSNQSEKDQIYVEIVRVSQRPNGQSAFQFYLRQRARLLK